MREAWTIDIPAPAPSEPSSSPRRGAHRVNPVTAELQTDQLAGKPRPRSTTWPAQTRSKPAGGPDPGAGRTLSRVEIDAALRGAGRQRRIDERAAEIQSPRRAPQGAAPGAVSAPMAEPVSATMAVVSTIAAQALVLAQELAAGLSCTGEFGDEPDC